MSAHGNKPATGDNGNAHGIGRLLVIVLAMFGFGFALVPIYDVFCEVTGLNGKTSGDVAVIAPDSPVDTSRQVTVEFIASLNANMPWEFEPVTRAVRVHPGEAMKVEYVARNITTNPIVGSAVPSVSPGMAAPYFQKTECFCFTEQKLEANEERNMPVIFVVDPDLPDDISTLTLSYTFFVKPGSENVAMLD